MNSILPQATTAVLKWTFKNVQVINYWTLVWKDLGLIHTFWLLRFCSGDEMRKWTQKCQLLKNMCMLSDHSCKQERHHLCNLQFNLLLHVLWVNSNTGTAGSPEEQKSAACISTSAPLRLTLWVTKGTRVLHHCSISYSGSGTCCLKRTTSDLAWQNTVYTSDMWSSKK